jgi:hypothetical protein
MTNIIFTLMMIFSYVVLYSLLGVIVAGGYRMLAALLNHERALGLPNDNATIGMTCVIWPMFIIIVLLGAFVGGPIRKLGTIVCNWFYVEDSSVVEKENE